MARVLHTPARHHLQYGPALKHMHMVEPLVWSTHAPVPMLHTLQTSATAFVASSKTTCDSRQRTPLVVRLLVSVVDTQR
jgi:hypothetical protein